MITRKSAEALQAIYTNQVLGSKEHLEVRRQTYLTISKYLQKESDRTLSGTVGALVNQQGDKSKIRDTELPIAFIQNQTAVAYLAGIFLGGEPIFSATSNRANEQAAAMLTALSQRDQHRLGWRGQLLKSLEDAVSFNVAPVEIFWGEKRASSVRTVKAADDGITTGELAPVVYEGNVLRRIDPNNLIADHSVMPHELHEHGAFAGYVESFNYIRMKKFFAELDNKYVVKHNVREAFRKAPPQELFSRPQIRTSHALQNTDNWGHFWGNNPSLDPATSGGRYEVVTLYSRIIPREYGLDLPKAGQLKVFKLIYVNGMLLYMEPLNTPHEFLPIVVGQMYRGDWEIKSFTEYVLDLQDLGTSMIRGTMDSMRRAVVDRGIYDPTRVRKADIDSVNPVAKIPVTTNGYGSDIRTAYHPIPFEDRMSGNFRQNLGLIVQLADQTTGQNQASQGNFIKGNKTMFEFDSIMSNSQARMQLGGLEMDASLFSPLKQILLTNYLVFAEAETLDDNITGQEIEVDPVMLRTKVPEFKMASGILPSTKIANTEVLMQALQLFATNPQLNMEYDTAGIAVSILMQQGLTGLDQYKRTPEQLQQQQQMMMAQQGARPPSPA